MKKLEAKLRVRFVLGTFPETLTRNDHLSLPVLKTPRLYNREVRYAIVLSSVGSIVLGNIKQAQFMMFINEHQVVSFKSLNNVINFTFIFK